MSVGAAPGDGPVQPGTGASGLEQRLHALPDAARARLRSRLLPAASGAALVAHALEQCGIRFVLGITGTPVDRVFAACAARGIRIVGTRHQQAAVLAAAAANYVAGRLVAAVVVSAGPAVTNTVTGLLVAQGNGWPVLVLGGRRQLHAEGAGYFQELSAVPIVAPVTKLATTLRAAADAPAQVSQAAGIAIEGRPGPVYLDMPEDVLDADAPETTVALQPAAGSPPDGPAVTAAAVLLADASRPLLILGENSRWGLDAPALRRFVEAAGLPTITSPLGRGLLPDDHPLCANTVRRAVLGQADVVAMVGACFDWRFRFGAELAPAVRVLHADYPGSALGRNVVPAVVTAADPGRFLNALGAAMAEQADALRPRWDAWRRSVEATRDQARVAAAASRRPATGNGVDPTELYQAVRDVLPADAIVAVDGSTCLAAAQHALKVSRPASWLDPGSHGTMGTALPFAMGAALAEPQRPSVALTSDMSFGLCAMELETAVRHGLAVVAVVANNDGNGGALRQEQYLPQHAERFSQYLPGLHLERIAEVVGGHAEYVSHAAALRPALARALAAGRLACVNVAVDPRAPHPGVW